MSRHKSWAHSIGVALVTAACRSAAGTGTGPVNPTPVAAPSPATTPAPDRTDRGGAAGGGDARNDIESLPVRPAQAPLVTVEDIVDRKVAFGRRVRVSGRCISAGTGRSAGLWTLAAGGEQIEVRGLVPKPCSGKLDETLTIFAQVERKTNGGPERLLLRLPGR